MNHSFNRRSVVLSFILPALLIYTTVVIVSIIWAAGYSLFDWNGMGEMTFIGLDNYVNLFTRDKAIWTVFRNTLVYTLLQIVIQVGGGLVFAIFLSRVMRFRPTLQTLYYMPVVISTVAICQIFSKLLSVTPPGVINSILGAINPAWTYAEWVSNPKVSLYVIAFVEGYKYIGLYMVIFYAALIGVPGELSEAAKIDGASVLRQYWNVKIPYIKPVIVANCVLVLNGSLRSFDISFLLTKGGPGNTSELMAAYMYKQAFSSLKYGYGSAIAIVIVGVCLIVGGAFRRLNKEQEEI